jgi:hypothetical protein
MINSIYNPKRKPKENFVFPKINKLEASPHENKQFNQGPNRKYNQNNIFKMEEDKKPKLKFKAEEEKVREIKSREYEELELKMIEMTRKHQ